MRINGEVKHALGQMDKALGQYVDASKKSVPEVVARFTASMIYGQRSPRYPGLYENLRELTPVEGSITQGRLDALSATPRGRSLPVKVRPSSRTQAEGMLSGRSSGLFNFLQFGSTARFKVVPIAYQKRGDKRLKRYRAGRGTLRVDRRSAATNPREKVLNITSLSIALELQRRESGRGYVAVSFLPKSYRRLLSWSKRRKSYSKVGDLSRAIYEPTPNDSLTESVRNKSGEELGVVSFSSSGNGAVSRIQGFTPPQNRAQAQKAVAQVIRYVTADAMTYVDRKLKKEQEMAFRQVGRIRA